MGIKDEVKGALNMATDLLKRVERLDVRAEHLESRVVEAIGRFDQEGVRLKEENNSLRSRVEKLEPLVREAEVLRSENNELRLRVEKLEARFTATTERALVDAVRGLVEDKVASESADDMNLDGIAGALEDQRPRSA